MSGRRRLLLGLALLLILLALIAVPTTWLIATPSGTAWLVARVSDALRTEQRTLSVESISGTIWDGVDMTKLSYQDTGIHVETGAIRLRWQPAALYERLLHINTLTVAGLQVSLPDQSGDEQPAPPATPARIELPVGLQLDEGVITDIQVRQAGNTYAVDQLSVSARAGATSLTLDTIHVVRDDASLSIEGSIDWQAKPQWQARLTADKLDPAVIADDWPGRLSAQLDVTGRFTEGLLLNVDIGKIEGQLRGYPLRATGRIRLDGDAVSVEGFELTSGENRIALNGQVVEPLNASFEIKAPQLEALLPDLQGAVMGKGSISGELSSPQIIAELNARQVAYHDHSLAHGSVKLNWRGENGTGAFDLSDALLGGTQVNRLQADIKGSMQKHSLSVRADTAIVKAAFDANGRLQQERWSGSVETLMLDNAHAGKWTLREPVALTLSRQRIHTELLCMQQNATVACTRGTLADGQMLDINASLNNLDFSRLDPYLPEGMRIEGMVNAESRILGTIGDPDVTLSVRADEGKVHTMQLDEPFHIAWSGTRVEGRFADDQGDIDLSLLLGGNGKVRGQLAVGKTQNAVRALQGELDVDFPDLSLLAGFVPALHDLQGTLHVETLISGTTDQPHLHGRAAIMDAHATIPAAGIDVKDGRLTVAAEGDAPLQISGQLRSGKGSLQVKGIVDPFADKQPRVDIAITGKDFQAARLPEATMSVSPALQLQGSGSYHLSGRVDIPEARIEVKQIPAGTVSVSDDEIIIVEDAPVATQRRNNLPVTAKVTIALGEQVSFEGFGLKTGLGGSLTANVEKKTTRLNGKVELRDGTYKAYGQDLKIEQGRLLFAGPADNPDIDLRAARQSRDETVTAYLAMSGPLKKPRPRVYSVPSHPDAEALAYLLTGNGLDQQGGENIDYRAAALSLGLSKSNPFLQQVGDQIGLDELRVNAGENSLEESSLVLGKYLNPDLYLGYTTGLFNPEGAVLLRLRLSRKIEVESRSGKSQSVDLFYSHEHD